MKHFLKLFLVLLPLFSYGQKGKNVVVRFDIREEIAPSASRITYNALKEAERLSADLVVINMNTFGGLVTDGDSIRRAILDSKVPVWVFIDKNAASAGALIAIACDRIYMAPGSSMGSASVVDQSGRIVPEKYQSYMRTIMRSTAESQGKDTIIENGDTTIRYRRDPLVAEAMVDPRTVVPGLVDSSRLLAFTPEEAVHFNYCNGIYNSIDEMLDDEGFKYRETVVVEKSSMDKLIGFLANPAISGVLISLIFMGIFFELRSPGVGFPLLAAVIAALLYFAPLYLEGLAANWEILLFIIGLGLIALEIFVIPGFGLAGISGIVLTVAALTLSLVRNVNLDFTLTAPGEMNKALVVVLAGITTFVAVVLIFGRTIMKSQAFNRVVLSHTLGEARITTRSGEILDNLVGMEGTAHTDLRPMGKVRLNNELVDAKTYGDFISKGKTVKVIAREYSYLIVEEA